MSHRQLAQAMLREARHTEGTFRLASAMTALAACAVNLVFPEPDSHRAEEEVVVTNVADLLRRMPPPYETKGPTP